MHKAVRQLVRKHRAFSDKAVRLGQSGSRKDYLAGVNNRHWFDRELKGELRTGNDKD